MTLGCFEHKFYFLCITIEFPKIVNFLDTTSDDKDLQRFVTKKQIKVYDQSGGNYNVNKKLELKRQCQGLNHVILMMRILL